ncbi:hypothetical protein EPIB2_1042 [Tritonibacter mobilis]|nr:hypothetical protein EPIB2_1042 [Tritonibacter mobilis]
MSSPLSVDLRLGGRQQRRLSLFCRCFTLICRYIFLSIIVATFGYVFRHVPSFA